MPISLRLSTALLMVGSLLLLSWPSSTAAQTMLDRRAQHFAALDRNQDGQLNNEELANLSCARQANLPCPMLGNRDTNQDGQISKEEFMAFTPPGMGRMRANNQPRCLGGQAPGRGWRGGWGGPGW
ncbi:EF-hand domain-containing protein [Candidatus Magnetaquicoccus inordinatus]|uniref:EF-hand domain-containing protein n=1 Tax=Candidatus Magnetaquicoccus inordinatus TaxID=2496818 RepID=UPI00187D2BAC|nr:EF-hand domain-containing protein [Candidatus Magnetaquicoccus inordinatus]